MPTQQLVYQGPDPKELIERVIDEHGPVRIRPPEKKRVGGLFGFFAKEVYVLTVDGGETAGEVRAPASPPDDPLRAYLTATADELVLGGAAHPAGVPDGHAVTGGDPGTAGDPRPVQTRAFSEVLARVASSMGEAPGEYRPDLARRSPSGTQPEPAHDDRVNDDDRAHDDAGRWPALRAQLSDCGVPDALLVAAVPAGSERAALESVFAGLRGAPPLPRSSGGLIAVVGASSGGGAGLAGVLGAAVALRPAARSIAADVGCAPEDIAVVCEWVPDSTVPPGYLAHTPEDAAALAPGWRRDGVGVVVVYAPSLGEDQGWARAALRAMRPSHVVGVVSATTKTEDVARWARAVGGVDSLALVEAARTATPAAVLAADIPVTSLDGRAATPAAWADLVAGRLAER